MAQIRIELIHLTPAEVQDILSGADLLRRGGCSCSVGDLVPKVVARCAMEAHRSGQDWFWCAPRLFSDASLQVIVGSGCFKGSPVQGRVEIGYGVAEPHAGKGYATAGVARLVEEAFAHGGVDAVVAETSVYNPASQRVLEKNGFYRTGHREDPEDGLLTQWKRECDRCVHMGTRSGPAL